MSNKLINVKFKDVNDVLKKINPNISMFGLMSLKEWFNEFGSFPVPEAHGGTYEDNIYYGACDNVSSETYVRPEFDRQLSLTETYLKLCCKLMNTEMLKYDINTIENMVCKIYWLYNDKKHLGFLTFIHYNSFEKELSNEKETNDFIKYVNKNTTKI